MTSKAEIAIKKLPPVLEGHRRALEQALHVPVLGNWAEDDTETFKPAEQPEAIAGVLVEVLHKHLQPASIAFLYRKDMRRKGAVLLGTASKVGGKLAYFTRYAFTIEINWTAWRTLTPGQRIALVDHELCHCVRDPATEAWTILPHDVEEFGIIVARWGLWQADLATFAVAVQKAPQLNLFDRS